VRKTAATRHAQEIDAPRERYPGGCIAAAASLRLHYGGFSDATAPLPLLQLA